MCRREGAECLTSALFNKFEEPFIKVSMEKGIMPNVHHKMDMASVEAMLCEAGLNTRNSRILFKHSNQFLARAFLTQRKSAMNTLQVKISLQW